MKSRIFWFTGLPNSGKSTYARKLYYDLEYLAPSGCVYIDDEVNKRASVEQIMSMISLANTEFAVVASTLVPNVRDANIIFCDAPKKVVTERDKKKNSSKFSTNEVVWEKHWKDYSVKEYDYRINTTNKSIKRNYNKLKKWVWGRIPGVPRTEEDKLSLLVNMGRMSLADKWSLMLDISAQEGINSKDQLDLIRRIISKTPQDVKSVLVVGCGSGEEILEFRAIGVKAEGISVNPRANQQMRDRGLRVHDMDMHTMYFKDGAFDMIYCKDAFKQAVAPTFAFAEFVRVAKKYIIIAEPDFSWAWKAHNYQLFNEEQFEVLGNKFKSPLKEHSVIDTGYVKEQVYLFEKC